MIIKFKYYATIGKSYTKLLIKNPFYGDTAKILKKYIRFKESVPSTASDKRIIETARQLLRRLYDAQKIR